MAYTVLNESLQVKGKLTLNNGRGSTAFFADTITQQIATDNSNDPTNATAVAFNSYDKQGNAKQWGHSITVSVEATDLGSGISTNDYLMYFDDVNNHYYLMKVITAETDRNSGFVTISGINTAIYELGKQIVNAETTFKQANLQTVVNGIYKNAPFSVVIQDDLATVIDYTVSANTSLQAVLQDLQTKYDVDVDSWIELDESGNISDRIIYFGHIGRDNGELIRYGGAKGFENINAQELSDTIYTKLYVTGLTNDTDPTKGHIGSVNNGMEYILDDNANAKQYAIGASQQQPVYLEGSISNTLLSEPQALLTWAKAQMDIFNHPRFNYTVTPMHDQIVTLGDAITVQDFHIKPEILVTSKVIQKSTSFSSPETNTFVLGEFSSIFSDRASKNNMVIEVIKKDVTVVQAAADYAKAQADEAHRQAVTAQEKAIHAQTSADGKTKTYTVDSVQDLPSNAVEGDLGWVKLSDGTHMYSYTDGKWVEKINPSMGADINKKVSDAVTQAKAHTATAIEQNNASQQEVMDDIAKSQADLAIKDADFNDKAQAMADRALSNAKSNTVQVAQETLNSANQNLADAKKSLTDGISKEASDRAAAVATANSQAQTYANQAKSDALNTIAKEVADRQNAVSALDTKATNAVNQAKSDITDTINALSVGGRNLIIRTGEIVGQMVGIDGKIDPFQPATLTPAIITVTPGKPLTMSGTTGGDNYFRYAFYDATGKTLMRSASDLRSATTVIAPAESTTFRISYPQESQVKLERGNVATDWTPAPEDVVLDYTTKDNQIKATITQYQTTNDGKVSKAQTDATTALGQVATKVSQTDYDAKTGDLTTKYTQVKQTTDSQATDIVDIKKTATSQASKINSISSDVDGTKQSISDIETTQDSQSDKINQITSDVNGTKQSITDIQTKDGKQDTRMGTIETSVSGVKSDFSTYKTDANGRISTAQTTAQTAVDGLKTKVSQTDYNTKTGQLQTDLITTTQTANQATTDITSIKQKDGDQDAKMNTIVSDANGTKQTVSDLKTAQGKQSGDISTLQQRANGFDATVTKVNNLQIGGTNLIPLGNIVTTSSTQISYDSTNDIRTITVGNGAGGSWGGGLQNNATTRHEIPWGQLYTYSVEIKPSVDGLTWNSDVNTFPYGDSAWNGNDNDNVNLRSSNSSMSGGIGTKLIPNVWNKVWVTLINSDSRNSNKVSLFDNSTICVVNTTGNTATVLFRHFKGESGNLPTDWAPAPEDISSATAKAQLTADNASVNLSKYQTDADGRISRAQSGVDANTKSITTKVSQTVYDQKTGDLTQAISKAQTTADGAVSTVGNYKTSNDGRVKAAESAISQNSNDITARVTKTDYDKKTGDLTTKVNTAQSTADSATSTIGSYKTSNDARVASAESKITTNANAITQKVSQTDYNQKTGELSGSISTLKQRADGFDATVTKVDNLSVGGTNLVSGTNQEYQMGYGIPKTTWQDGYAYLKLPTNVTNGEILPQSTHTFLYTLVQGTTYTQTIWFETDATVKDLGTTQITWFTNSGHDVQPAIIQKLGQNSYKIVSTYTWPVKTDNNVRLFDIEHLDSAFDLSTGTYLKFGKLKLEKGNLPTDWSPAPEDTNNKISTVSQTVDSISSIVSDPTTGLSTRVQTAEGTLSKVQGIDIPALQNATFWQPYSSLNFNDYTKQGSFFFNTTAAKTNGPTTSTSWLYLIVEQGTADTSRIKQTAWYDGVAGVKITYVRTLNSGTWSPWYANDNDSVTTISQTNSNVRQEIADRKTGDNNTLQSSKDFTQSSITSAVKGVNSTITQTSDSLIAKINTKTDSDTVLSLLKNNWSIGITDNISKITSGIVGNASQMSLISKNVTIDSPNTQITGTAWIKSAMIANGAIGTAQIGDAVITSAKIANLDVSKLTGDTITGFNFNVNRSMNIASGGVIKSDVINMDKTSFILNTSTVATDTVTTAANNKMILSNVTYSIDSTKGAIISSGKVNLSHTNGSTSNANFDFRIAPDYFSMSSKNWSDGSNDNYMTMTDYSVSFLVGSPLIDKASSYSYVGQDGIATTGTVLADAISGHGSKPMYINAGGTLRLAANDGSGVKVYISNTNVQTDSPIISGNITLNTGHAIVSNDNGKMFFYGSNGNQIDLGVRSLTQSSLVSLKEHISNVDPEYALNEVLRADVRQYNFRGDDITDRHVSPMIDDVDHELYIPNDWLDSTGKGVDTYTITGYLIQSIKALKKEIEQLKQA